MKFIRKFKFLFMLFIGMVILSGCANVTTNVTIDQSTSEVTMESIVSINTGNYDEDVTSEDVTSAINKSFSDATDIEYIRAGEDSSYDKYVITYKFDNIGKLNEYLSEYIDGDGVTFSYKTLGNQVLLYANVNEKFEDYIYEKTVDVHGLLEMGSTTADEVVDSFDLYIGETGDNELNSIYEYGEDQVVSVMNLFVKSTEYTANVDGKYSGENGVLTSGPVMATIILDPAISNMPETLVDLLVEEFEYNGSKMVRSDDGLVRLDIEEYSSGGEVTCNYNANFIYADVSCALPEIGFDSGLYSGEDPVFADAYGTEPPAIASSVKLTVNGTEMPTTSMQMRDYKTINIILLIVLSLIFIGGIIILIIILLNKRKNYQQLDVSPNKTVLTNSINDNEVETNKNEYKKNVQTPKNLDTHVTSNWGTFISSAKIPFIPLLVAICGLMTPLAGNIDGLNFKPLVSVGVLNAVIESSSMLTDLDDSMLKFILVMEIIRIFIVVVLIVLILIIILCRFINRNISFNLYKTIIGIPFLVLSIFALFNIIIGVGSGGLLYPSLVNFLCIGLCVFWTLIVFNKKRPQYIKTLVSKIGLFEIYLLAFIIISLFGSWAKIELDLIFVQIILKITSLTAIFSSGIGIAMFLIIIGLIIVYICMLFIGNNSLASILKIVISTMIGMLIIATNTFEITELVYFSTPINLTVIGILFSIASIVMVVFHVIKLLKVKH